MTARLEKASFDLRFSAKQLGRESARASKGAKTEKEKLLKAIQKHGAHSEIAKIHAQNAVRKEKSAVNLSIQQARIEEVQAKVDDFIRQAQHAKTMRSVVSSMKYASGIMDPAKVMELSEAFEKEISDLNVTSNIMSESTKTQTAVDTPQEEVDRLISQTADAAGVELSQEMEGAKAVKAAPVASTPNEVEEDKLGERLRALRA
ncbi:hypothetical protein B0O99DRAFT_664873 [Bisporella sp. PMI_857]|nr:hypothetical protein B0O99DRAFT_664873 [Bisporella sp. PMI_857]